MYQLNPALRDFWTSPKPYKLLRGGRFSSKTHDAAGMAAFLARNYSVRFLCVRQFQNRISDSVYTLVKDKIQQAGWELEFDIGVSTIQHKETGSEFLFYGIARNLQEIKGTEGVDILWIEEAEGLTEDQWRVLDPTVRKEHSQIWVVWNPRLATDFVQTRLPELLGDDAIIRHINYDENPFLPEDARRKAERLRAVDVDEYRHVYLGEPKTNEDAAIIQIRWIEAAINAHEVLGINLHGASVVGYDVADTGEDKNAAAVFDGAICVDLDEWAGTEDEMDQSAMRAWGHVGKGGTLVYDSIGVGAHVGSTLRGVKGARCVPFNAGARVHRPESKYGDTDILNKDKFENLKAQAWRDVADRFRRTYDAVTQGTRHKDIISIAPGLPHLDRLKLELSTPRKTYSKRGLDQVESKKDLARRDVKSPNLADAFIMGACRHLLPGAGKPQIQVAQSRARFW